MLQRDVKDAQIIINDSRRKSSAPRWAYDNKNDEVCHFDLFSHVLFFRVNDVNKHITSVVGMNEIRRSQLLGI